MFCHMSHKFLFLAFFFFSLNLQMVNGQFTVHGQLNAINTSLCKNCADDKSEQDYCWNFFKYIPQCLSFIYRRRHELMFTREKFKGIRFSRTWHFIPLV